VGVGAGGVGDGDRVGDGVEDALPPGRECEADRDAEPLALVEGLDAYLAEAAKTYQRTLLLP